MKVYVVHDGYGSVYGVMTDYTRAQTLQNLASREKAMDGAMDSAVYISEQNLDEPAMGGA